MKRIAPLCALFALLIAICVSPFLAARAAHPQTTKYPVITSPCGTLSGVLLTTHQATKEVTQYRVTFTAQGEGFTISFSDPIYYWVETAIKSPGAPQTYTDTLTVDDPYYNLRLTGLGMHVQAAPCSVYNGNMTVTNASIEPLQQVVHVPSH